MLEVRVEGQALDRGGLASLLRQLADGLATGEGDAFTAGADCPAERLSLHLSGEAGVDPDGRTVTVQPFRCARCGAHALRGDPFYEDDERLCMDCGMEVQDGQ